LGCDPHNESAVRRLFDLKQRPAGIGVLLIAADFLQVADYLGNCPADAIERAKASWPGPNTWIFPASKTVPSWVVGEHVGIAIRITAHPVASALCRGFGGALVSSSANIHGQPAAKNVLELRHMFADQLDAVVDGALGGLERPTTIRDAISGNVVRH
ncbi:MAG: Sua5/YciO/YrdC/YwlC family protein, partial [Dokdonella sp.]